MFVILEVNTNIIIYAINFLLDVYVRGCLLLFIYVVLKASKYIIIESPTLFFYI